MLKKRVSVDHMEDGDLSAAIHSGFLAFAEKEVAKRGLRFSLNLNDGF